MGTADCTRSWPFQTSSRGFCNFCRSDLVHKLGNKQDTNFFLFLLSPYLHVPMNANPSAPSGKDCQKQCDILVWFMPHPWLLAFATAVAPLNSDVYASGPACCHSRLSNSNGTLSKLKAACVDVWGVLRHWHTARRSKKRTAEQRKQLFQAFSQPIGDYSSKNCESIVTKFTLKESWVHTGEITKLESWMWLWAHTVI